MGDTKIEDLDLYELLNLEITSSTADIKKAYRKKALECHPDKNPDNANAAQEFHRLSKILEILIDEKARAAYDRVLKGRKESAIRHRELDSKRRKLKEELEGRERSGGARRTADQNLHDEIERLRKEGSKQVAEEVDYVLTQLKEQFRQREDVWDAAKYRIKIKWAVDKGDTRNGGYTHEMLVQFLAKYGDISALVVSTKKKGTALVEFKTKNAAQMAVELEVGLSVNPLKLEWVNEPPSSNKATSSLIKDTDFESIVLTKMRQAEERKRLIEQLKADDGET